MVPRCCTRCWKKLQWACDSKDTLIITVGTGPSRHLDHKKWTRDNNNTLIITVGEVGELMQDWESLSGLLREWFSVHDMTCQMAMIVLYYPNLYFQGFKFHVFKLKKPTYISLCVDSLSVHLNRSKLCSISTEDGNRWSNLKMLMNRRKMQKKEGKE